MKQREVLYFLRVVCTSYRYPWSWNPRTLVELRLLAMHDAITARPNHRWKNPRYWPRWLVRFMQRLRRRHMKYYMDALHRSMWPGPWRIVKP